MPRGIYANMHKSRRRKGTVVKTCGECPCCRALAEYRTQKSRENYQRKQLSDSINDEELERRILAKQLSD